jgi:hypothetical protein
MALTGMPGVFPCDNFKRSYLFSGHPGKKIDQPTHFDDRRFFFTDDENKSACLIVIFVGHVKPEITAAVNSKAISPAGTGDAFASGACSFA